MVPAVRDIILTKLYYVQGRLLAQELSDSSFVLGSVPPMQVQQHASDKRAGLYDLPDIGVSNVSADTALFFLKHGGHPLWLRGNMPPRLSLGMRC